MSFTCTGEDNFDGGGADAPPRSDAGPTPDAGDANSRPDAGPAQLILDQTTYDFGPLAPGQSAMRTFTVTNTGGGDSGAITVSLGGNDAGSFTLDATGCQGNSLTPGNGCSVAVTFSTTVQAAKHAVLMVSATPGGSIMATLDGSGLSPAALTSDPPSLDFGTVTNGTLSSIGVSIRNGGALGTGTLTTTITGADATRFQTMNDTCNAATLAATSSCTMSIVFAPTTSGTKTAKLSVGDGVKMVDVTLGGTAVAPGALSIMPSAPAFATVAIGGSSSAVLTVKNTGGTTVTGLVTSISGGSAADFSLTPDGCNGQDLGAGASCNVTIKFQPTVAGNKSASFSVSASSGGSVSKSLSATATAKLTVVIDSTDGGSGTVSSNPGGISCPGTCMADMATTSVQLAATSASDSSFGGWSLGSCGTALICTVSLSAAQSVHATFVGKKYTLTVMKTGAGTGRVTSSPPGIDCTATCSYDFRVGQSVTLSTTADAHAQFMAWSGGGCSGANACSLTLTSPTTVSASFARTFTVTAAVNICSGATWELPGRITSSPEGIDCSTVNATECSTGSCSHDFVEGTQVQLTALPSGGALFAGWLGGPCAPDVNGDRVTFTTQAYTNPCILNIIGDTEVSAEFGQPLTVSVTKSGSGEVFSIPTGLTCVGGTCTGSFGAGFVGMVLRSAQSASWSISPCPGGGPFANACMCSAGTYCYTGFFGQSASATVTFP